MNLNRQVISKHDINFILNKLKNRFQYILDQKGYYSYISSHEFLGVLREEVIELEKEIHLKDRNKIYLECFDVAVPALFAAAGILSGKMEID